MAKLRVGLLYGGRSTEHEISVASATSIRAALDPERYDVQLIAVDHDGRWHLTGPSLPAETPRGAAEVLLPGIPGPRALVPSDEGRPSPGAGVALDVLFPIIHGRGGEDGSLQGLMELAELPYVGSGVLSSALQMDKDVAKQLMHARGLPVVPWVTLSNRPEGREAAARRAVDELGLPIFVKPANSGSSVGTSKAHDFAELLAGIADAGRFDTKILLERAVDARELEVGVIGNHSPEASLPGEIVPAGEFYDYESKYVDEETELRIPAPVSDEVVAQMQRLAVEAFTVLCGSGLARVDFLLERESGTLYINELNSLPGFTDSSMFPRLWEATGLSYPALLDRLIELALERHAERAQLETLYERG